MIIYLGTILNLDGWPDLSGDIFDENSGVELLGNPIAVTFEFNNKKETILGRATLFFSDNKVKYEMRLDDTRLSKERLDSLFPCIGGVVFEREEQRIVRFAIDKVALCSKPNQDYRIKTIGEQT